ncbi:unnamed protein product [Acanthoscelides obtectus]|uniref:Uncharacterized protein n=1 Tax=Acanthoscelides obtectus TaxID=200917 RepID=A0A9P0Q7Q3_ACAOB|nr:unnamed protein product [Acanthoscelides obtectus]CAK1641443.1 hypothetical protein AOBTE_LOCUS12409 [Acanthoscelides obtectus]
MEVDEAVVDLSIGSNRTTGTPISPTLTQRQTIQIQTQQSQIQPPQQQPINPQNPPRRVLRPRSEHRTYVESPDAMLNGTERPRINGSLEYSSDSSDEEMPPLEPVKEFNLAEMKQRFFGLFSRGRIGFSPELSATSAVASFSGAVVESEMLGLAGRLKLIGQLDGRAVL